jgi:hypothetical protein
MKIGYIASRTLLAGSAIFAVGTLFHLAVPIVAPSLPPRYADSSLFRPWSGWTSKYMFVHPFGFGLVFATIHQALLGRGGLDPGLKDGLLYGLGLFLVGSLPVFLLAFASFRVSPDVIASWSLQNACQYLAAGAVVGWLARR